MRKSIAQIYYHLDRNYTITSNTSGTKCLPNVILGVTTENQRAADERIQILLFIPASKYFISWEPGLEAINIKPYLPPAHCIECKDTGHPFIDCGNEYSGFDYGQKCHCQTDSYLDWVIAGAESGNNRRPCNIEWVRNLKNQCVEAGVPFFYKQGIGDDGKWRKMPSLDGRVWNQILKG
jgi:protein gp37